MLGRGSTVNDLKAKSSVEIEHGETLDLMFQLINDDTGQRYIPATGATVQVQIPRYLEYTPTITGESQSNDYSVNQAAVQAFVGDASVWKTPLTSTQTSQLTTQNVKVIVTEGTQVRIAVAKYGIRVFSENE